MYICNMIYKNNYEVYEDGNIFSYKSNKFMKPFRLGGSYLGVSIDRKPEYVHRIVANCFLPNPNNKDTVNHKSGDKTDNSIANLEWMTLKENINYSFNVLGRKTLTKSNFEGKRHTEETKKKMSASKLGKKFPKGYKK
jgi:hypothetical protein